MDGLQLLKVELDCRKCFKTNCSKWEANSE